MDIKIFKTVNDLNLIIKRNKSNIAFEIEPNQDNKCYKFSFKFISETFNNLLKYIEVIAKDTWENFTPKEATSIGSDYNEYYDRKLDSNGCLSIYENTLIIERPSLNSEKLYQFNKGKMESFIYDFRKIVGSSNIKGRS